ncbi:TatD family hydrolase [Leptolyngbya sp. PCC 6406]|uniref:TatD family hydrolase n=1 Tax=Leptolyngbya sp. PCC 6406 TaxID=1173264 RepID=UPI0002AC7EBE|nr:TatD family hydrolase [Leptolyngbya sp. PCC 6406]
MRLIDTHVHINFDSYQSDLDQVAAAWRAAGVVHLVHSCVEPGEFPKTQAIADRYPEVSFAVGLHPLDMDQWDDTMADRIEALARCDQRVVAIGETGLDFFKASNQAVQQAAFWAQLAIAHRLELPVIVHCRDAAADAAALISRFIDTQGPVRGVMHCWAGSPEETQWFLDLGFFISFSGIVTFKNAHQVKDAARMVPNHRLLIETDCPFLTPEPRRQERRNQPAHVRHVADYLAQLRQTTPTAIADQTTRNAIGLFRLPLDPEAVRPREEPVAPTATPLVPVAEAIG